ncbi:hypothetical protein ABZP36_035486 [Zizania latifolia]
MPFQDLEVGNSRGTPRRGGRGAAVGVASSSSSGGSRLSQLVRWMVVKAEELGVEVYPGFAAKNNKESQAQREWAGIASDVIDIWDVMNGVSYVNPDTPLKIADYYKISGVSWWAQSLTPPPVPVVPTSRLLSWGSAIGTTSISCLRTARMRCSHGTLMATPSGSPEWMGEMVGNKQADLQPEGCCFVTCISWYVRDLAILVFAYGISINLVEVTWKSKLKAQYPSPNEYSSFMGDFSTATGIVTFTMMLLGRVILSNSVMSCLQK